MNVQKQSRATILSLLFDCDVTQEKGVVLIEVETRKKMGKIMKEGLLRSCCCIVGYPVRFVLFFSLNYWVCCIRGEIL